MPFKTTVNWQFNDIWCYLVIGCFSWKIVVFQQTVVRVYYILKIIQHNRRFCQQQNFLNIWLQAHLQLIYHQRVFVFQPSMNAQADIIVN